MKPERPSLRICLILILLSSLFMAGASAPFYFEVRKGNSAYEDQKYDQASEHYEKALQQDPASGISSYNQGNVHYRKGEYDKAAESYQKSISGKESPLAPDAYYNLGNSLLMAALPALELEDPAQKEVAGGLLNAARDSYKMALSLNPEDAEAKYNLEYTLNKIKEFNVEEKQEPSSCSSNKDDENKQERQKDEKKAETEQSEEKQQESQAPEQDTETAEKQEGQQQQQQQRQQEQAAAEPEKEKEDQQKQQASRSEKQEEEPDETKGISMDEAASLLNIVSQQEKEALKNRQRVTRASGYSKDW
jgi:outer membrane biosynthesis protein TonB